MKKLFVKAIEWLMAAFRNTQSVYDNENLLKVKGDRLEVRERKEIVNSQLTSLKTLCSTELATNLCSRSNATFQLSIQERPFQR